ncbi:MAG: TA system VapC family ribonuclease toxin [Nitriliruptorales bacterium]
MILCDGNVWLALALSGHAHHPAAADWLETVDEPDAIRFCRATQQTYLRLLTNAAVLAPYGNRPLTNDEAWAAYDAFLEDDRVTFQRAEPAELESIWHRFARAETASPKLWMDAYLAAFAYGSGFTMVTTDAAFRQFDGLDLLILS